MIVGIDTGKTGGIAQLMHNGEIVWATSMPSMQELVEELCILRDSSACGLFVFLEKAQAFPGQGVVGMFNYGDHYGQLQGILIALRIPYELVPPQTWTKSMLSGTVAPRSAEKKIKKDKSRNIEAARRLFPTLEELRKAKPHTGIVDALLIAEYGRRKRMGLTL